MRVKAVIFLMFVSAAVWAQKDSTEYKKFRLGGYGEMLFQRMDYGADRYTDSKNGAPKDTRSYVSIPRMILALDYKFRDDIVLGTEIEFEYGGVGSAMELEYDEAGEYEFEIEKGGEVQLEQFHITKRFYPWLNVRAGHFIVPVGLTNAHHEPIFFFGTTRPEGEMTILPCTWHETGISILGKYKTLSYEVMVINGLDPNGFSSSNWIQGGKQGMFESYVMTSPAYAGRVEYAPVKGLRLGASGYFNKTAPNASMPQKTKGIDANVAIGTFDAQYINKNAAVRANFIYGHLTDALRLTQINKNISKATTFARTPVAETAMTYSVEAGYNVLSFFGLKQKLMPFVRYEYYNSAERVPDGMAKMPINKREILTVGANYALLPNLIIKADYNMRRLDRGNFNNENTLGIGVGYIGWFIQK
jgi:opacity protein-like surface antigen